MEGEQNNVNVGSGEGGGSLGPIIGGIVILVIIILGGLYFWGQRVNDSDAVIDGSVESINMQSDSDAAAAIEADLDATDVENLDSEINAS